MSEQNLTIEIEERTEYGRMQVIANRQSKEVEITHRLDDAAYDTITLSFNDAYRLMELIKAAIEVKV